MRDEERGEMEEEWKILSRVMNEAAKDVCGVATREVSNPWVIGHEGELDRIRDRVKAAVRNRDEWLRVNGRRRQLRPRGRGNEREAEVERLREEVKNARGELKGRMRELERDWWREKINECETACVEGRLGDMY